MAAPFVEFVPQWAKGIVWYQIYPERFWNGDPANDPTSADQRNAWPHDQTSPWQIHPWTADWYALQPYERQNGRDLWHNIHRRRYGGDLQGILDRLDYLHALGVEALYLNPIFEAPSDHKYDGATYHHIDPTLGPDPAGDRRLMAQEDPADPATWVWTAADRLLLQLVQAVHRRGMRIILDGVFNHMGLNSWAYQDVRRNQRASRFADWFKIRSWDDPAAGTVFAHEGWAGAYELPELRQDENGIVAGPRDYIFACTRRWMDPDGDGDPSDGIDGWRLDVAFCVAHPFWKAWRRHVRAINPEAYLVAEIVQSVAANQAYVAGDEFDAVMHYNFAWSAAEWLWQAQPRSSSAVFDQQLHELATAYPPGVAHVMQNLYDSHDTARLATHIVNRAQFDYRDWVRHHPSAKAKENPAVETRKPTAAERQIQRLAIVLQMTFVGAPMIYMGSEAGMWGANDPCCRKPCVWPELAYEPEARLPDGRLRASPDEVAFDHALFAFYKQLIAVRKASPALRHGTFETVWVGEDLYGFCRRAGEETVLVLLNRGAESDVVTLPTAVARYRDLLSGELLTATADGLSVATPAVGYRLLTAVPD